MKGRKLFKKGSKLCKANRAALNEKESGRRKRDLYFLFPFFSLGRFKVYKSLNRSVCATAGTDQSNEVERVKQIKIDDTEDPP